MPWSRRDPVRAAAQNAGKYRVHYYIITVRNDLEGNGEGNRQIRDHVDVSAKSERDALDIAKNKYHKDLLHTPRDSRGNPVMSDLTWAGIEKL